jgi:hypothetical protein
METTGNSLDEDYGFILAATVFLIGGSHELIVNNNFGFYGLFLMFMGSFLLGSILHIGMRKSDIKYIFIILPFFIIAPLIKFLGINIVESTYNYLVAFYLFGICVGIFTSIKTLKYYYHKNQKFKLKTN